MKMLLKKIETVNLDEVIIEDGKEVKRAMPYLKLSMYCKPEDFPDALSYRDALMVVNKPNTTEMVNIPADEYEALRNNGNWIMPYSVKARLKAVAEMLLNLLTDNDNEKQKGDADQEGE